jgi:hypothetical protein
MKSFLFGMFTMLLLFIVLFIYLHRLGKSPRQNATGPSDRYLEWKQRSAEMAVNPEVGSEEAKALVMKVQEAFTPFTVENVSANFPKAYADELYFRDAFHTYTDLATMLAYMIKSAEMSPGVTFEFSEPARNGIDFYLPWTMVLADKNGGEPQKSIGVSRLRFNAEGKVIFHQDYWDSADVLVPKVPVANGLIEAVRRRF